MNAVHKRAPLIGGAVSKVLPNSAMFMQKIVLRHFWLCDGGISKFEGMN